MINNVNNDSVSPTPPTPPNALIAKMKAYRDEFRELKAAYEADPSDENLQKLSALMYHMRTFLEDHKAEIFKIAKQNGWPAFSKGGGDGYEGYFDSAMNAINTFLNPSDGHTDASLMFLNEQFTQLTWLESSPNNIKDHG